LEEDPANGAELIEYRPYQLEVIEKGIERQNLLIALTMGAGKTAATIGITRRLREEGKATQGMVFALNSTKFQWVREINRFDPEARVLVIDGDKKTRNLQYRHARRFHYVVLHYECLVNDWDAIQKFCPRDWLVSDECTTIKSFTAQRSKRLKALGRMVKYRYALSGQPVENRPEELFSIMEFVDPTILGPFDKFDRTFITRDNYGRPRSYKNLHTLFECMSEVMYRKSREDIKEWLPEMVSLEIPIPMDAATLKLHETIKLDLIAAIDNAMANGNVQGFNLFAQYGRAAKTDNDALKGVVMSKLLAMRMLASHPYLLSASANEFDDPNVSSGSAYAAELRANGDLVGVDKSAKLDALIELIDEILNEDPVHKVVVFSYFKPMLAIIENILIKKGITSVKITGDVATMDRDKRIQAFNGDQNVRVFLSSDAGAYGVNLDKGSHLICYDLPWSSGTLSQRISRIDRTSSTFKTITVLYLYGKNTIEERMLGQLQQKMAVAGAFLDGKFDEKTGSLPLDFQSLKEFLLSS
jgi:hypothetical protein